MLTTIALALTVLRLPGPAPRVPVTGTYAYGAYGRTRGRSGAGCLLQVAEVAGARLTFQLDCSLGPPSHNLGQVGGTVPLRRGAAVYRTVTDGEPCEVRLAFAGAAVRVEQTGGCGFGRGVYASGAYQRLNRARPRFESPP